jgi:hypothetical protein
MVDNPFCESSDVLLRGAGEASARNIECSLLVQMHRQPQLIVKLLGKTPGRQTIGDAGDELSPLFQGYFTMLQAAAHHCPRPPVPKPLRFCEDELNTFLYCARFL